MSYHLENDAVELHVTRFGENQLQITGSLNKPSKYTERFLMAANPIDRMMNYSGSGLTFPNPEVAFENTPNLYKIPEHGKINTNFIYPNGYYSWDTLQRVVPSIFVILKSTNADSVYHQLKIEEPLPLKTSVTYRPEHDQKGPMFYSEKEMVMGIPPSQEWILRNIGDIKVRHGVA